MRREAPNRWHSVGQLGKGDYVSKLSLARLLGSTVYARIPSQEAVGQVYNVESDEDVHRGAIYNSTKPEWLCKIRSHPYIKYYGSC